MKLIGNILLAFLPSFLQVPLRRILGQKIGKDSKIKFGSVLLSSKVDIGKQVSIGPFCLVKCEELKIGDNSAIKSLSAVSTRIIEFGRYVHIAPLCIITSEFTENSKIVIGDHSRIFPFCWLDTGEGIFIGENVGVGGHTLIFTHGVWSDYLEGGPVSYGPVTLKNNVWLPWRIFILPNVEIGENSIVGANSLVNKSFPKNALLGGSPAKLLKENMDIDISAEEKIQRTEQILTGFSSYIEFKHKLKSRLEGSQLIFDEFKITIDKKDVVEKGDLLMLVNSSLNEQEVDQLISKGISVLNHRSKMIQLVNKNTLYIDFISYLRRYGIRLYIDKSK